MTWRLEKAQTVTRMIPLALIDSNFGSACRSPVGIALHLSDVMCLRGLVGEGGRHWRHWGGGVFVSFMQWILAGGASALLGLARTKNSRVKRSMDTRHSPTSLEFIILPCQQSQLTLHGVLAQRPFKSLTLHCKHSASACSNLELRAVPVTPGRQAGRVSVSHPGPMSWPSRLKQPARLAMTE